MPAILLQSSDNNLVIQIQFTALKFWFFVSHSFILTVTFSFSFVCLFSFSFLCWSRCSSVLCIKCSRCYCTVQHALISVDDAPIKLYKCKLYLNTRKSVWSEHTIIGLEKTTSKKKKWLWVEFNKMRTSWIIASIMYMFECYENYILYILIYIYTAVQRSSLPLNCLQFRYETNKTSN